MKPIISPWTIYFASRADSLKILAGCSDESTYRKYHGRIGQTVSAVLVTKTYDDGEVRQYINRLGGL